MHHVFSNVGVPLPKAMATKHYLKKLTDVLENPSNPLVTPAHQVPPEWAGPYPPKPVSAAVPSSVLLRNSASREELDTRKPREPWMAMRKRAHLDLHLRGDSRLLQQRLLLADYTVCECCKWTPPAGCPWTKARGDWPAAAAASSAPPESPPAAAPGEVGPPHGAPVFADHAAGAAPASPRCPDVDRISAAGPLPPPPAPPAVLARLPLPAAVAASSAPPVTSPPAAAPRVGPLLPAPPASADPAPAAQGQSPGSAAVAAASPAPSSSSRSRIDPSSAADAAVKAPDGAYRSLKQTLKNNLRTIKACYYLRSKVRARLVRARARACVRACVHVCVCVCVCVCVRARV